MEVILKPTCKCNFACSFCSSGNMQLMHQTEVSDKLKCILQKLKPNNIIVTGGEPLMCPVSYYERLLSLGNWTLSFTSNLKDFYLNPGKWLQLFKNSRVNACTSFQYGKMRRWNEHEPYDETKFIEIFNKFYQLIGYKVGFLSVISNENEHVALKHLELARRLGTKCKLNCLMPLGKSKFFYPQYKLIKILLDAIDLGYSDCLNMDVCFKNGGCNFNTSMQCQNTIRAIALDNTGKLLYSNCEDNLVGEEYLDIETDKFDKKAAIASDQLVSSKCLFCELFFLCNSCKQIRNTNKLTQNHCEEMKKLMPRIKSAKWRLQP